MGEKQIYEGQLELQGPIHRHEMKLGWEAGEKDPERHEEKKEAKGREALERE